jgi:peptidoglycan/LPS O-acetylase OafA/YrhL
MSERLDELFKIARAFAYPLAASILLAHAVVIYAVYSYLNQTWAGDDPRMLIPATCFLAFLPGAALLAFSLFNRRRLKKTEFYLFFIIAISGIFMLPSMYGSAFIFDW